MGLSVPRQLPLSLPLRDSSTLESFVAAPGSSVQAAVRQLLDIPGQIYVWGAAGTGRSHLLEAAGRQALVQGRRACLFSAREMLATDVALLEGLEQQDCLAIDDIDALAGRPDWEEGLFHLYNRLVANGCSFLCSAALPPAAAGFVLADLASRLAAGPVYHLGQLDDGARAALESALDVYRQQGAEIVEVSLPNMHLSVPTYYVVAPAEASSNLARYDGVRYGHRAEGVESLESLYKRSRGEGFGREVQRRIMVGTYVLSAGYYDAYYLKAQQVRQLIADDFARAFEEVDAIIGPTTQGPAFALGEKTDDPVAMYLNDIYTIAANLAGLPALSMPAGLVDGKPVGVQLIGKAFDETGILSLAHQFQSLTDHHVARPEGF